MEKMVLPSTLTMTSGGATGHTDPENAWPAFMMPGEEHKVMAAETGNWRLEFFFFSAPGTAPQKGQGLSTHSAILGGRYYQSVHQGNIMGMPFEGQALIGYDNHRKIYFSTWIDNMGTDILYSEGQYNAREKRIELTGKRTDPTTGEPVPCKQFMIYTDEDNMTLQRFDQSGAQEFLSLEVRFMRIYP